MSTFETSNLWKRNLASQRDNDPYKRARDKLRLAFLQTREAVTPLVTQIGKELPGLTVHDITHLDHLWQVADILMGNDYPINPAETFVLGMAFLLHDAATSTFAFPNGIDDLRKTIEWNDFAAQKEFREELMKKGESGYQLTLFETLRLLHPHQAEKLLTQSWHDLKGMPRWLMEDVELRNHYGRDIGRIAASHGKDSALAEQEWANAAPLTTPSCLSLPATADWKIDRLKIAMLLRCIDAAHIDNQRAPDMLAALIKPVADSRNHWIFQNRLGNIGINNKKEVYWSGQAFEEHDADAWWLCYKTVQMVDREIRTANLILENNNRTSLHVVGAMGAQDLKEFQKAVPTQGWHPVDINFQVSQISDVVEKFGGKILYGDKSYLALRELIQNSADAIRARRIFRDKPEHGRIDIALTEENGDWWLHVQDDGIGMSRYVLTNVLLDFGRSLWRDDVLREQWAGLAGKGFEAVGQFGIGFFSVFMLGDEVKVTTWRLGDAEIDQSTLYLRQRTDTKPILKSTPSKERLNECGTRISVRLSNGRASLLVQIVEGGQRNFFKEDASRREMTLDETVGVLAPALDMDVWCQDGTSQKTRTIEANDWKSLAPLALVKRLVPQYTEGEISHIAENFHDIKESDGKLVGRASFKGGNPFTGFGLHPGILVYQGISMGICDLTGILLSTNNRDLARSIAQPVCSAEALTTWAEQVLENFPKSRYGLWVSHTLLSLGVSDTKLPIVELNTALVTPAEFMNHLQSQNLDEILFLLDNPECPDSMSKQKFYDELEYYDFVILNFYHNRNRENFRLATWIDTLLPETDDCPRTITASLGRAILSVWPNAKFATKNRIIGEVDGEEVSAKCLVVKKAGTA